MPTGDWYQMMNRWCYRTNTYATCNGNCMYCNTPFSNYSYAPKVLKRVIKEYDANGNLVRETIEDLL